MIIETMDLWDNIPEHFEEIPKITAYIPKNQECNCAILFFAGGCYWSRSSREGGKYAQYFAEKGIVCFVVDYRVFPHKFPAPLLDARRAVQFVRHYAEKFGVDKNKIAVFGASAGGHLAALVSTYYDDLAIEKKDAIDGEDYIPNAQILAYPVIKLLGKNVAHLASGINLLGEQLVWKGEELSPDLIATNRAPKAFIFHTLTDSAVPVVNSMDYAKRLQSVGVNVELHIFHRGEHGDGICGKDDEDNRYVAQWATLCLNWLKSIGFYKDFE